jgi:hypothetical protein
MLSLWRGRDTGESKDKQANTDNKSGHQPLVLLCLCDRRFCDDNYESIVFENLHASLISEIRTDVSTQYLPEGIRMKYILIKLIIFIALAPSSVLATTLCERYESDLKQLVVEETMKFETINFVPDDKSSLDMGCVTSGQSGRTIDLRFYRAEGDAANVVRRWMQMSAKAGTNSEPVSDTTLGSQGFFWFTKIGGSFQPNLLVVKGHDANVYISLEITTGVIPRFQLGEKDIQLARKLVRKAIADAAF